MKKFMSRGQRCLLVLLGLTLLTLTGCASKMTADLELNKKFVPAATPDGNRSVVYVIRQSSMLGAARGLYVGLNEHIKTNLYSGQYSYFLIDDGVNTLNLDQGLPFHYRRLDGRGGETIFYYFEMTSGKFEELDQDTGITAVMKSTKANDVTGKENPGYSSALLNPAFVDLYLMEETKALMEPDAENAVITFLRPQSWGKEIGFGIWDENGFLGNLKGETFFQIKVPPGKYTFLAKSEHFAVLETDTEAGKNYYVQVVAGMGWAQAHVKLLPVTAETDNDVLRKWLQGSKAVRLGSQENEEIVGKRLSLAMPLVAEALEKVATGKAESRKLNKEDGR